MSQGAVSVHNADLCSELLGERPAAPSTEVDLQKTANTIAHQVSPRVPSRSSTSQAIHAVEWLSRKARRAVVALPDEPELRQLKKTCEHISSEEHSFFSELNEFLIEDKSYEESKRAMLFKKWNERVFNPIQQEIRRKMQSQDYQMLDNEKRELFDKYLKYSTRQDVFLDTISREEYNPDSFKQIKVTTHQLSDPLRAHNDDADCENKVVQDCQKGIPLKKSAHLTSSGCAERGREAVLWLAMELVYIDSTNAQTRRNGISVERNKCSERGKEGKLRIQQKRKSQTINHQQLSLHWKDTN